MLQRDCNELGYLTLQFKNITMKRALSIPEMKKVRGGFLPFVLILVIDATLLGFMSGYIYESFTSDHQ